MLSIRAIFAYRIARSFAVEYLIAVLFESATVFCERWNQTFPSRYFKLRISEECVLSQTLHHSRHNDIPPWTPDGLSAEDSVERIIFSDWVNTNVQEINHVQYWHVLL